MTRCFALAALALSLVFSASAQEVVEDTTSAWRYVPLNVGDAWEYDVEFVPWGSPPQRSTLTRSVRKDTLVDGRSYRLVESRSYTESGSLDYVRRTLVRFDTTTATRITRELPNGSDYPDPCPLDLAFGIESPSGEDGPCGEFLQVMTGGGYDQPIEIGSETYTATSKWIGTSSTVDRIQVYVSDIGVVSSEYGEAGTGGSTRLRTARIRGQIYGDPPSDRFPVDRERGPEAGEFDLTVYPNPATDALALTLRQSSGRRARVEAFDALGRRVLVMEVASGLTLQTDVSGWAPGVYVLRATSGDAHLSRRVVVR